MRAPFLGVTRSTSDHVTFLLEVPQWFLISQRIKPKHLKLSADILISYFTEQIGAIRREFSFSHFTTHLAAFVPQVLPFLVLLCVNSPHSCPRPPFPLVPYTPQGHHSNNLPFLFYTINLTLFTGSFSSQTNVFLALCKKQLSVDPGLLWF